MFVVGIALSAGGLDPLCELLAKARCHKAMCFVVISHMHRAQESKLPQILSRAVDLKCVEAQDGMELEHCTVFTIPPNHDLSVQGGRLHLHPRPTSEPNRAANFFLESLAREYRDNSVGVVLSGSFAGQDGADGIKAI